LRRVQFVEAVKKLNHQFLDYYTGQLFVQIVIGD
jgi:hypothetical protein